MRAHKLILRLAEHQVANLGISLDRLGFYTMESVPETNTAIRSATPTRQQTPISWRPGQSFDRGSMTCKFPQGFGAGLSVGWPHEQTVIVSARSQLAVIPGPLQTTNFLLVTRENTYCFFSSSHVMILNGVILGARTEKWVWPRKSPNSASVSLESSHQLLLIYIPNLNKSAVCAYREMSSSPSPTHTSNFVVCA